ncbi:MAG: signal peptidase I [Candidatus Aenigmarchaeota archaeon]|nr:signal peptidase I [Candidatus Aenigmarchaeota archaeon]
MKLKEPYSTIAYVILGVLLAVGINAGLGALLGTDLPIVAVESDSMKPTFAKGDILILQGKPNYTLTDIIVFSPSPDTTPVVHRVVAINTDGSYQTKGDANANQLPFEKHIPPSAVHGKVILIVPYLGWIKIGITEFILPNAIWIAVVVIFVYLAITGLRRR